LSRIESRFRMAGHSKWANIQYRKGAQDKKRGRIFTKLIREITTAARVGGGDPNSNPRLRMVMEKARAASMPRDNIERAVKRGTGELGADHFEEIRYEGYGPGGAAVMVQCLTDNRNRTVSEVRYVFTRHGGNLGADGSVGYLFNHVGMLCYPPGSDEDRVMEAALEAGAEDVITNDDRSIDVLTDPGEYERVRAEMSRAGFAPGDAEITMRASTTAALEGEQAESMLRMLEALEDLDDVQNVYSNADLPDEILARA
jgi:YebC/PmpR family DNA-binding regulatory protein